MSLSTLRLGSLLFAVLGFFMISCTSSVSAQGNVPVQSNAVQGDTYRGEASDTTLGSALTSAVGEALRAAVIDRLGASVEKLQNTRLKDSIYGARVQNSYIYRDSIKTLVREAKGSGYRYVLTVRVNLASLDAELSRAGLTGKNASQVLVETKEEPASGPNKRQKALVEEVSRNLLYMVYFKEGGAEDPSILKAAVSSANKWLLEHDYNLVEFETIEKIKKESRQIYESQSGEVLAPMDWIAQDQGVDVVLELDVSTTAQSQGKSHSASANLIINIKDPSTGKLTGTTTSSNPAVQSAVDQYDARFKAVASAVYFSIPDAVDQSRKERARQMEKGIRYTIELQNTPDTKTTIDFRSRIRQDENVVSIKEMSKTKTKTFLEVYYYGTADDLEELAFASAASVSGLENFDLVLKKGRNLIFETGM